MKQITFKTKKESKSPSMEDLRSTIITFLNNNGCGQSSTWADKHCTIVSQGVNIQPICSNPTFTKSLALLQLILSQELSFGYLKYNKDGITIVVLDGHIDTAINYINNHSDITIS